MIQFYTTPSGRFSLVDEVAAVIDGGCRWINLCDASRNREALSEIMSVCRQSDAFLVIDDDIELVKELRVHGVRLTSSAISPRQAREQLGPHAIIGVSVSTVGEIASLKGADVDYVTVDVTALSAVAPAAASLQMPVVATGEVTLENMEQLIGSGAQGLGFSESVVNAPDSKEYMKSVMEKVAR